MADAKTRALSVRMPPEMVSTSVQIATNPFYRLLSSGAVGSRLRNTSGASASVLRRAARNLWIPYGGWSRALVVAKTRQAEFIVCVAGRQRGGEQEHVSHESSTRHSRRSQHVHPLRILIVRSQN